MTCARTSAVGVEFGAVCAKPAGSSVRFAVGKGGGDSSGPMAANSRESNCFWLNLREIGFGDWELELLDMIELLAVPMTANRSASK